MSTYPPHLDVETVVAQDHRLGRQKVHDERSRAFPLTTTVDRSTWRDKAVRIYDPAPNPNQCHGECTGCAEMMMLNSLGNRRRGIILNLTEHAHAAYAWATNNDPWDGAMVYDEATKTISGTDTGSSGLAAAKASVALGYGIDYRWLFGGADEVVQNIMDGRVISAGTWWHADMFGPSGGTYVSLPVVTPTGGRAGGHQYVLRGYDVEGDLVMGRCWWGSFRDFWIKRIDLDTLLRDGGDAHHTRTV